MNTSMDTQKYAFVFEEWERETNRHFPDEQGSLQQRQHTAIDYLWYNILCCVIASCDLCRCSLTH